MTAYYNENDAKKAAWLRELIKAGLIAPGEVDERSIENVTSNELAGFTQCHFFAGIGIWSYALRLAGWPDDRKTWTGSCPCQPFSVAGKSAGFADERHLWPAWFWLIEQCKPGVVFGEQVASKDGYAWLDLVQADMEGVDYAFGPVALPAAGFGAPHGRHRIFFVADSQHSERWAQQQTGGAERRRCGLGRSGDAAGAVADTTDVRRAQHEREPRQRTTEGPEHSAERDGTVVALGHTAKRGQRVDGRAPRNGGHAAQPVPVGNVGQSIVTRLEGHNGDGNNGDEPRRIGTNESRSTTETSGPVNGFWRDAEWLYCKDEKYRAAALHKK